MVASIIQPYWSEFIAFALTYLVHSSTWILLVLCLVRIPFFNTPLLKNYLWKGALIGGLLTSLLIHFSGNGLLEIQLEKEIVTQEEKVQPPTTETLLVNDIPDEMIPIAPNEIVSEQMIPSEAITINTTTENKPNAPTTKAIETTINFQKIIHLIIPLLGLFWAIGSLLLFLKEGIRHIIFIKKISPRHPVNHPTLTYLQKRIRLKKGQTPNILLSQSATLESPILIQNKEICLPQKAVDKLDDAQMKAMLAHELAHVIRKDYYWNCFLVLLDTLLFFQPLHRIAIKEIQTTNELLCDEWAAKIIGNHLALAQCLLTVAEWIHTPTKNYPLIAGMSLKKSELSNRIISLINLPDMKKQRYHFLKAGLPFATLLLLAILILPGFTFTNFIDTIPIEKKEIEPISELIQEPINEPIPQVINEPIKEDIIAKEKKSVDDQINEEPDFNTIGWGQLEQKVKERSGENYSQNDLATNLELGKFLPEKSGIKIPFYAQHSAIAFTPEFDPYDLDAPLKEQLESTTKKSMEELPILGKTSIQKEIFKTPTIKLEEKFAVNKNHKYFDVFHKIKGRDGAEGKNYIKGIYYTNLGCAGHSRQNLGGPIVTNKGAKNSLIFTLDYGTHVEYDTLQNCVHPPKSDASKEDGYEIKTNVKKIKNFFFPNSSENTSTAIYGNVDGKLPEVVESNWVAISENQKQTPIGIKLKGKANVKIAIETTKGQPVVTIMDGVLEAGTHEFIFQHINIKKGTYRLVKTVNGETLRQNIRVYRTRFTNKKEKNSCAPLLRAVKRNNAKKVQILVQEIDPNCEYREEGEPRSPLNAAARKGNVEIGKILLAANADVEFRARGDEGALIGAARNGHLDFVKLMIENGAEVNKTVGGDGTALINSVRGGHYEVTEYLLQNGADPMFGVSGDENPIYHASNQGDKMLDLLLKYRKSK